jgi:release factor glutamine methyltransferase
MDETHLVGLVQSFEDLAGEPARDHLRPDLPRPDPQRHGVADRIRFLHGEGFAAVPSGARFDLVISNPPYIPRGEIDALQPEVRDHDPHVALDGGVDGLDYYRLLAAGAGSVLAAAGRIMLEFGDGQADRVRELFDQQNWIVDRIETDYTQRPRITIARRSPA